MAFNARFPGIETIVHENTTAQLLKQVLAFEVDLALASCPIEDKRVEIRDLFSEELMLALPPGHPLLHKRRVNAADLRHERLIVMKSDHCLGDQVLRFCDQNDARPSISFRSAQLETIQALTRAGMGLSLIPEMAVSQNRRSSPEYRSLSGAKPKRKIVALWPKQRPPSRAANEFLQLVRPTR